METKFANLPADSPVQKVGPKLFAIERREYRGEPQISLVEVAAEVDASDPTTVTSWRQVFKGVRLNGKPQHMLQLADLLRTAAEPNGATSKPKAKARAKA